MSDIKLIQILRTFSNEEFTLFKKFVASPYFNEGRNYIPLINELKKHHPEYNRNKFVREKVFKALYPEEKYNSALLDTLFSRTAKLAENFLVQEVNRKNEFHNVTALAKEYCNRNIGKLFNVKVSEAEKILEKVSEYSLDYFNCAKELEIIKMDYLLANKDYYPSIENLPLRGELNLLDLLIKYIHSQIDIQIAGYETNNDFSESVIKKSTRLIDIEGMIKLFESRNSRYAVALKLKYFELLAIKNADLKHFLLYRNLIEKNIDLLPWSEKFNRILSLLSACNLGLGRFREDFTKVPLELAKFIVDQNVHAINEKTNTFLPLYINLLGTLKEFNESAYIDKLILNLGSKIEPELKESLIAFSHIEKFIAENNFQEALKFLGKVDFNHSIVKVRARINAILIYYELGYTEELLSLTESTVKFLNSIENHQTFNIESAINYTKFVQKMVKFKQPPDKDKLDDLKQEIKNSAKVMMKSWLLEKIDGIK